MTDNPTADTLITLTADIVAAHVSNNTVTVNDVPALIANTYSALTACGSSTAAPEKVVEPAVSIRSSIKPDSITCLVCGSKQKMLKRHIATAHGLDISDYRAHYKLPADYPLVAPNYAEKRRDLAKKIGLGRKPGQKPIKRTK